MIGTAIRFIGERYAGGICLGFGVATAQYFLKWGMTISNHLPTEDWRKLREEAKNHPDALWSWRKS